MPGAAAAGELPGECVIKIYLSIYKTQQKYRAELYELATSV